MKISKTALWLSAIDALLVLTASASGIFLKSIYARETLSWAVQGIGQDIINLIAAVVLFIAAYFVNKGSFKAFLIWRVAKVAPLQNNLTPELVDDVRVVLHKL